MGKIGYGYGSEWHLLRYLGRHRDLLTRRVLDEIGGHSIEWRDGLFHQKPPFDAEWKAADFLPATHPARIQWLQFWPQSGNTPNWDAIGVLTANGEREWLLVEAKGNLQELRSTACSPAGSRKPLAPSSRRPGQGCGRPGSTLSSGRRSQASGRTTCATRSRPGRSSTGRRSPRSRTCWATPRSR